MSSKYDKQIAISHEEEGSYHRREVDCSPSSARRPVTTYHSERYVVPAKSGSKKQLAKLNASSDDDENFEEWTTSKRKVNHTTRQVETRVSRQLLVEDGKVIADSGPQVTTRIKEDNKVEECEKEKTPKNKKGFEALENAPESADCSGRVLGEKREIQRVSHEVREENMQYHDERFKELSGRDVHRRAIKAPHELMTIKDEHERHSKGAPRGKMVHYSNKGKKYQDTDEILEVAKLAIDGSVTKEVKRTRHHEEFSEDEKPDEKGEAEALRQKPLVERSSRRHVDYVNDFDDIDGADGDGRAVRRSSGKLSAPGRRQHDDAFPRYEIDPLLDSLREEDFKVAGSGGGRAEHAAPVPVRQRFDSTSSSAESSSGDERARRQRIHSPAQIYRSKQQQQHKVEIPEEYRVNKQRLMSNRSSGGQSPTTVVRQVHKSRTGTRREDASVQARLTDEEEQLNVDEKHSEHAGRQSSAQTKATRHYHHHYGSSKQHKDSKRRDSVSSSSSSSLGDVKARKHGVQSRDSGFRSPGQRAQTPSSQIYSVSSKAKGRLGAPSPTPSAGQRSVKTTTTTVSAGLKERPLSREHFDSAESDDERPQRPIRSKHGQQHKQQQHAKQIDEHDSIVRSNTSSDGNDNDNEQGYLQPMTATNYKRRQRQSSVDTISISSLNGPNATKIKVPYRKLTEVEQQKDERKTLRPEQQKQEQLRGNEMGLGEDIENLSRRLANIRRATTTNQGHDCSDGKQRKDFFDYKTMVANINSATDAKAGTHKQVIGVYNVQLVEQSTPFTTSKVKMPSMAAHEQQQTGADSGVETAPASEGNNNEASFNLNDFNFKYRAVPALVEPSLLLSQKLCAQSDDEDERVSQASSCSLQSSKTYNVRRAASQTVVGAEQQVPQTASRVGADLDGLNRKNPAWIFDPRDGSSTAIAPPPKPMKPPTPKVQTEELVQAPGGRSYYLELLDRQAADEYDQDDDRKQRERHEDGRRSLYSRWNSQGALNVRDAMGAGSLVNLSPPSSTANNSHKNRSAQQHADTNGSKSRLIPTSNKINSLANRPPVRKQLPYGGLLSSSSSITFGNRSKSSSCLLNVTKPSKYSIYGGYRRPGETNKPVPRLSYSRAIGPRSQRQIDAQPKVPSRYLKMK